ncbi:MAG: phosphoribosylamine--glycine ligase [Endomicrobium sp.]|jgi:phosphoribosylamine--glycine ligase|nr:phosphoribosylamine--glycine ligase [Endomicrobium sp.]
MRILVVGSGGREHAVCWQFAISSKVEKIFCAPGNGGISQIAENVDIAVNDFDKLAVFAKANKIDLTFVGPEVPLSLGIVDCFRAQNLKIVGPSKNAARLESSKIYSKKFMQRYDIPTARYDSFSNIDDALKFLENCDENKRVVIKADGLAAGKGVYVCNKMEDAKDAVVQIMNEKKFGADIGKDIIIEDYISGFELSYLLFTDGISYSMMPVSQDHKRLNNNDLGPNTGGMGAYSPVPLVTEKINKKVEIIVDKIIEGMKAEKFDYKGVLYVGIIMNDDSPYVLEFNCRFGDPEAQVVLSLLNTDLIDICTAILDKKLFDIKINWKKEVAVCVVLTSGGYPGKIKKGFEITGFENIVDKNIMLFHAATKLENGRFVTSGGRVLNVVSTATDMKSAISKVYKNIDLIHFDNMYYRTDIAWRVLNGN